MAQIDYIKTDDLSAVTQCFSPESTCDEAVEESEAFFKGRENIHNIKIQDLRNIEKPNFWETGFTWVTSKQDRSWWSGFIFESNKSLFEEWLVQDCQKIVKEM